jgi:hypothetical protein
MHMYMLVCMENIDAIVLGLYAWEILMHMYMLACIYLCLPECGGLSQALLPTQIAPQSAPAHMF